MYTTLIVCAIIVLLSIFVSYYSRRGAVKSLDDVLTGHRSFGAFILFFVSVGEIYGIGTMLGVPGAVYSKGTNYTLWFMGYILLSYCVGYFLNPLIWRAGKKANLSTNADFFGWRFGSKGIEVLVAIVGIMFVMPWAQMNFAGLGIVIKYLGIPIDYATSGCHRVDRSIFVYRHRRCPQYGLGRCHEGLFDDFCHRGRSLCRGFPYAGGRFGYIPGRS